MAPPAAQVPKLMKDLFKWLKESGAHPLVKSCVDEHYEIAYGPTWVVVAVRGGEML